MKAITPAEKSSLVRAVRSSIERGQSLRRACLELAVSPASFLRWEKELVSGGIEALMPTKPSGRPPVIAFSDADLGLARWHRLCKDSLPNAVYFYCLDPASDPQIVAALRQIEEKNLELGRVASYPMSVRRAFAVTDDERARFRSKKAVNDTEMVTRRGLFYFDEDGHRQTLLPGELWELDDYSCNQPYTYLDPASGELNLGRQILAAMDVATAGWLGFDLIGRERDAYRGEDIVRFISRLIRSHGMPRVMRLERGSWDSTFIHGIDNGHGGKWGALDDLFTIIHTWKSKGKGTLEGSFNPLQSLLSHSGRDIGRYAGEFEESAKAWRQAKSAASKPDPRALGFWQQDDCAAAHEAAANLMNSRPRNRKALAERVSSNDLRTRHGWHTTPIPASESWRLMPIKQRRIIRDGHVTVNPGGGWPEVKYVVNGIDGLCLETGHAVFIACDPADPSLGATIANADSSARNRKSYGLGQILLTAAPFAQLAPQFDLSGRKHGTLNLRKKAAAAANTEFRAIQPTGKGQREITVTNGNDRHASAGSLAPLDRDTTPLASTPPPTRHSLAAPLVDRSQPLDLAALERDAMSHF